VGTKTFHAMISDGYGGVSIAGFLRVDGNGV